MSRSWTSWLAGAPPTGPGLGGAPQTEVTMHGVAESRGVTGFAPLPGSTFEPGHLHGVRSRGCVSEPAASGSNVSLVLGPLLRYAGSASATFWVETSAPCEVEVLGHRASTFAVEGHHYALLLVDDLEPASVTPYDVRLDGAVVWPPDDGRPQSRRAHAGRGAAGAVGVRLVPGRGAPADVDRGAVARGGRANRASMLCGPTRSCSSAARPSGPTLSSCSGIRSTPTRCRRRRSSSSAVRRDTRELPASRSRTSRSTRVCTGSRGRIRTSAGCSRRCRRR